MRVCTMCKHEFPLTVEFFHRDSAQTNGFKFRCKACTIAHRKATEDPATRRAYTKAYALRHPERLREQQRASAKKRQESGTRNEWRKKNREHILAQQREWRKVNERGLEHVNRRRARKKNAEGSHTYEEWLTVKEAHDNKCASCHKEVPLTRDHIIPLTKGGSDWISNIQPLCGPCNSSKGNKILTRKGD